MTILSGETITHLSFTEELLEPFCARGEMDGISHGVSHAGYDLRLEFDSNGEIEEKVIRRGEFLLASTIEEFKMPRYLVGVVHDKSSWARKGLAVQNTVIEPGWSGFLTLELTNHGPEELVLKRGVGICQVLFHHLDKPVAGYAGKYQNQDRGPVEAKT